MSFDPISYLKAKEAKELADNIVDGEVDKGVLRTNIDQKLNDLEEEYAPKLTQVSSQLAEKASHEEVNSLIGRLADATPKFASGTSGMLDNTRLYVNTSNGLLYAHNGVSWVSTGVHYQSTGLSKKSVGVNEADFIDGVNLFDGTYVNWVISLSSGVSPSSGSRLAIVKIEPNTKYFISKNDTSSRFRVAITDQPYGLARYQVEDVEYLLMSEDDKTGVQKYSFTSGENTKLLFIHVTNIEETPKMTVSTKEFTLKNVRVNVESIDGIEGLLDSVEVDDRFTDVVNLFDGVYAKRGIGLNSRLVSSTDSRTAIFELEPFQKYCISKVGTSDRFRVGLMENSSAGDVYTLVIDDGVEGSQHYSFASGDVLTTLVIQVSSKTEEPELYISKESRHLRGVRVKKSDIEGYEHDYFLSEPLVGSYVSPELPSSAISSDFDLSVTRHTDIYVLYDELVSEFPDYVKRDLLGVDELENEIYQYSFLSPKMDSRYLSKVNTPKIILTTGVHGNEKLATWSTAQFFKDLCYNAENKPELEYLKENIDLLIIPVSSPSSYNDNTRENHNGVNINRNFPADWIQGEGGNFGGEYPLSEKETVIIRDFMLKHRDAFVFLDHHNTSPESMLIVNDSLGENIAIDMFKHLTNVWNTKYNITPINGKRLHGHASGGGSSGGTCRNYAKSIGLNGITLESTNTMPHTNTRWDKISTECATDFVGNAIVSSVKYMY